MLHARLRMLTIVAAGALAVVALSTSDARADPPTFSAPPDDVVVEATRSAGTNVTFPLPSADDDNGPALITCDRSPGDFFPIGLRRVTCIGEDRLTGERGTPVSFNIRVIAGPKEQAKAGNTQAKLYYVKSTTTSGLPDYKNMRLRILREGRLVQDAAVARFSGYSYPVWPGGYGSRKSVAIRDLDLDGEPEVILDLYWGGAHCCFWTDIYRYDGSRDSYELLPHLWGDVFYKLGDADGDGRSVELISKDGRFAYEFTSFADSSFPVQIWAYGGGRLVDVTRRYKAAIAKDAATQWSRYLSYLKSRGVRGFLAAWAADKCLLNQCNDAFNRLKQLAATSRLTGPYDDAVKPDQYLTQLRRFLQKAGYWR
jgi:hypothetical protein